MISSLLFPFVFVGKSVPGRLTRLLALLAAALFLGTHPELRAEAADSFNYVTDQNTITITGYTGTGRSVITIPATLNGLPVTAIGDSAFSFQDYPTQVTLPDSITTIGLEAFFGCRGLTQVTIPNSVTNIGDRAFAYCNGLTSIEVASLNGVYSSADGVLFNKAQTAILQYPGGRAGAYILPSSVTDIRLWAFTYCAGLTQVTIPSNVTTIGESAFAYCTGRINLRVSDGLIPALASVCADSGRIDVATRLRFLVVNDSIMLTGHDYSDTSWRDGEFGTPPVVLEIPSLIEGLPVRWVGDSACGGMALSRVVIPHNIVHIGRASFASRTLKNIEVVSDNPAYRSVDGVLFDRKGETLQRYPAGREGDYSVPGGVAAIAASAFKQSEGLIQVTVPDSVVSIGDSAFELCYNLSQVVVGKGFRRIGNGAFDTRYIACRDGGCYFCGTCFYAGFGMDIFFLGDAPMAELPFGPRGSAITGFPGKDLSEPPRIHRAPDAQGWEPLFGGIPTDLWRTILVEVRGDALQSDLFNLHVVGKNGQPVILEASQNLRVAQWIPVGTNSLADGVVTFSDPDRGNHFSRFYRLRTP